VKILLAHEALTGASPGAVAPAAARTVAKFDLTHILAAATLVAASTAVFADTPDSSTTAASSEVVITAQKLNDARSSIETKTGASTYKIDTDAIQAIPGGENTLLNQVLLRAPDVAQDSFGQLHVRGEHNGLQYRLNGIILPEGISVFSQAFDPRLVESLSLIMGALPAEYGLRTAGIIDITTRSRSICACGRLRADFTTSVPATGCGSWSRRTLPGRFRTIRSTSGSFCAPCVTNPRSPPTSCAALQAPRLKSPPAVSTLQTW
jgi:hypothetical protein